MMTRSGGLFCVSWFSPACRVRASTCFVRKKEAEREEMDGQGGREKVRKMMRGR